jgi:hypothetical protein
MYTSQVDTAGISGTAVGGITALARAGYGRNITASTCGSAIKVLQSCWRTGGATASHEPIHHLPGSPGAGEGAVIGCRWARLMLPGRLSQIVRHPAAWLAACAPATPAAAARANTRPIINTTGPPTAVAARRCGKSAMVARMTVSSGPNPASPVHGALHDAPRPRASRRRPGAPGCL